MATNTIQLPRLRRIYVWELPVRIYHWLNFLVLIVLVITGFFIANPLALLSKKEASQAFTMGWFRYLHFAAAYIFMFNFLFRIYWGFVGNKYSNWKMFIPTSLAFVKDAWKVAKYDILLLKPKTGEKEHIAIGHNSLAGFTYFVMFLIFLLQCLTGLGLYASMSSWWFPKMFSFVPAMFGGDILLRQCHHLLMWAFILFAVVHVYLVFYHDYVEGRGETSSMVGGWKFLEDEAFKHKKV